jgi:hypothetical protein
MSRSGWLLALLGSIGCSSPTAPIADGWPWHNVSVSGDVLLVGRADLARDTVQVGLRLRNRGSTSARVEFGVCAFAVQGIGRHGAQWNNHPAPNMSCADFALVLDLQPGESREIPVYRKTAARIRELVPRDYYEVYIFMRQEGVLRRLPAGGLDL